MLPTGPVRHITHLVSAAVPFLSVHTQFRQLARWEICHHCLDLQDSSWNIVTIGHVWVRVQLCEHGHEHDHWRAHGKGCVRGRGVRHPHT